MLQILNTERLLDIRILARFKVVSELCLEIAPIHNNQHSWILQCRMSPQLLTCEDHGQRFPRTLGVPEEARFDPGRVPVA